MDTATIVQGTATAAPATQKFPPAPAAVTIPPKPATPGPADVDKGDTKVTVTNKGPKNIRVDFREGGLAPKVLKVGESVEVVVFQQGTGRPFSVVALPTPGVL